MDKYLFAVFWKSAKKRYLEKKPRISKSANKKTADKEDRVYMSLNLSINVLVVLLTNAYFLHVDPVNISIVDLGDKIRKSDFLK